MIKSSECRHRLLLVLKNYLELGLWEAHTVPRQHQQADQHVKNDLSFVGQQGNIVDVFSVENFVPRKEFDFNLHWVRKRGPQKIRNDKFENKSAYWATLAHSTETSKGWKNLT